jgi:hypothetical protein
MARRYQHARFTHELEELPLVLPGEILSLRTKGVVEVNRQVGASTLIPRVGLDPRGLAAAISSFTAMDLRKNRQPKRVLEVDSGETNAEAIRRRLEKALRLPPGAVITREATAATSAARQMSDEERAYAILGQQLARTDLGAVASAKGLGTADASAWEASEEASRGGQRAAAARR